MRELIEARRRAAEERRLPLQACAACGGVQAAPRPFCSACGSERLAWRESGRRGRIAAVTLLSRAPTPAYKALLPYAIALVDLAEGPRVMGHAAPELRVGTAVAGCFRRLGDRQLLYFERAEG